MKEDIEKQRIEYMMAMMHQQQELQQQQHQQFQAVIAQQSELMKALRSLMATKIHFDRLMPSRLTQIITGLVLTVLNASRLIRYFEVNYDNSGTNFVVKQ